MLNSNRASSIAALVSGLFVEMFLFFEMQGSFWLVRNPLVTARQLSVSHANRHLFGWPKRSHKSYYTASHNTPPARLWCSWTGVRIQTSRSFLILSIVCAVWIGRCKTAIVPAAPAYSKHSPPWIVGKDHSLPVREHCLHDGFLLSLRTIETAS